REISTFLLNEKGSNTSKGVSYLNSESNTRKIHLLTKNKSGIVNINPINLTLAKHGITSNKLRKIGTDHASRIHEGRNDSYRQYLQKLACRQVVGRNESVESYGVINDTPSFNC